ncbi:MAG TPA: hypothetical protein VGF50_07735 [Caulobacteraceae bacterium]|jgi:hypothetical protein
MAELRTLPLIAAMFALTSSAAMAAPRAPIDLVRDVYARLIAANRTGQGYDPGDELYSPRLLALEAAARKAAGTDVPCGLDFDIWFDGQEYDLKSADVTVAPGAAADAERVIAKFQSLGHPHEVHFTFRRIGGRWRLDDAESVVGTRWVFSRLLKCEG